MRFNFDVPANFMPALWWGLALLWPLHALACRLAGLYRGIWLFASLPDLKRVLRAVGAVRPPQSSCFFVLFRDGQQLVPRSLLVLYPMLLVLYMGGGRAAYRMWKEHRLYGGLIAQGKPVVIVGAGRGGAMLVRELERSSDWRVVGLVDDDAQQMGPGAIRAIRSWAGSKGCPRCLLPRRHRTSFWPCRRLLSMRVGGRLTSP